jgi:hypothetical protein
LRNKKVKGLILSHHSLILRQENTPELNPHPVLYNPSENPNYRGTRDWNPDPKKPQMCNSHAEP